MENNDLYLRIKQAREHSKLTQAMLAISVGVKRSSANQWESAHLRKEPSTQNLIKIATITGVSFEWLATGRGDMVWHYTIKEPNNSYGELSPKEKYLLGLFAKLPERRQKALLAFLGND
ncbi:MAG: helix-turn-helix domain-containing protein [Methylovulum sp.]|uniref:helix-turn-helix domain-containing protein n=1 Tax=Methylovulum sp. TaxID=1916980 RepID=UPI00263043D1|nr:helix-turn-helix domain-containing protein [Methylovulum sp.]MDD2724391.1 helix-turn-helix domain-containing protein [Methylovulum sp.]MDD5124219.1 helix-turn-helix domain-containing protein [Methylovulum sp.]